MSTPEDGRTSRTLPAFATVVACVALATLGANLPSPIYPLYQADFALSSLDIAVAFGVYALVLIPVLIIAGGLSDAIGRRPVLLASLAVGAAGSAVLLCAEGLPHLVVGRALQGIAVGAAAGAAAGALRETQPRGDDVRAAQFSSAAIVGGGALGPLLAGTLVEFLPWPRQLSFAVHLALLGLTAASLLLTYAPTTARGRWRIPVPHVPRAILGRFLTSTCAAGFAWAVIALFLSLIPSFMSEALGITHTVVTGSMVALVLAASAAMQFFANAADPYRIQVWGLPVVVLGLVLLLLAERSTSVALLVGAALLAGIGHGLVFLGATKTVNLAAPTNIVGGVTSAYFTGVYLGIGVPVIGVGLVATRLGLIPAVEWFAGVTIAACAIITALLLIQHRRPPGTRRSA